MTNASALNDYIQQSGLKKSAIAEKMGINRFTLYKKINGETEFTSSEILALCKILGVTSLRERENLFFAPKVDK